MAKLIPLEEVEKYTHAWTSWDTFFNNQQAIVSWLKKLPTIDPIEEIEKMQEQPQWIPVTEKTPNTDEPVFTYCNWIPTIAKKIYSWEWVEAYDYEWLWSNVKFWMPLPPHP